MENESNTNNDLSSASLKDEQTVHVTDQYLNDTAKNAKDDEGASFKDTFVYKRSKKQFINEFVPFLLSAFLTLLFFYLILPLLKEGSFLSRLFLPEGSTILTTLVPVLTLFLFIWVVIDMLMVFLMTRNEKKLIITNKALFEFSHNSNPNTSKVASQWKGTKRSKAYQRMIALLKTIESAKNIQNVYEVHRYQADLDSEKATSKYTFAKIAIWAMPILGFLGTVLGIGMAVGNFSGFLTQDIENIDIVKGELSKVTTGLSFAFDTTLFGLLLSMIAMFVTTFIQKFEQKILTTIEELGIEIIEKTKIEEDIPVQKSYSQLPIDGEIIDKLNLMMDEKIKKVSDNVTILIDKLDNTSKNISAEFEKIPIQVEKNVTNMISQLENSTSNINAGFEKIPLQVDKNISNLIIKLEDSSANINAEAEKIPAQIEKNISALLKQLEYSANSISSEFEKIPIQLGKSNEQYKMTIDLVNGRLEEMQKGFTELSLNSEKFYNGDLAPVLHDMKVTLQNILPVLETLTKPTEIIVTTTKK